MTLYDFFVYCSTNKERSMRTITRTVYGAAMQTAQYLGKRYTPSESSTLNEKFGIQANALPGENDRHKVQYFCIGNGGHRVITGAQGIPYTTPNNHQPTDAACFNHMPFVMREVNNDLNSDQRARYGLRREETHGGIRYFAYYARRMDLGDVQVNMHRTQITDGNQNTQPFEPTNANLNPEPIIADDDESNVVEASGEYVAGSAVVTINFTESDADELREVARILYGDEQYAVVSEIALVGGVDRSVDGVGPANNTILYDEVIGAQITTFISAYYQMNMQNNGFTFTADVGITEPMFESVEA